ncbi:MAG TPA: winged helix-turn-helix domain-containing protein [Candidatus Nitrosotalea sp.]|nr:winged helix-turn-helix domain-containing protein [Candidatus Nitrosotalea sp.]
MGCEEKLTVPENGKEPDLSIKPEEYIEVISTEDQRIKIIGEELANDTGRAIFAKISQGVTSSNEIAKALDISLPLVNWHVNRLLGVGLIKVDKVEMSQKNKEMKYYAPVKTALVIIPPENPDGSGNQGTRRETVLTRLRHFMASIASFVVGASGIYLAERSSFQNNSPYVPQSPPAPEMHAAIKAAPLAGPVPPAEPSALASEPLAIIIALLAGTAFFCAVFFGIKLAKRAGKKKQRIAKR